MISAAAQRLAASRDARILSSRFRRGLATFSMPIVAQGGKLYENKKGGLSAALSYFIRSGLLPGVDHLDAAVLRSEGILNLQAFLAEARDQQRIGRDLVGLDQIAAHRLRSAM